ncbi:MAG: polyphosphate kinase 1 [Cryomorphaceae bacterium]
MATNGNKLMVNRELSWLSFNHRVLQEAQDPEVPLVERLRFLGIFSNNLDEFFRVRVATIRRLQAFSAKKAKLIGGLSPDQVQDAIQKEVVRQKNLFGEIYSEIIDRLREHNIFMVTETELSETQEKFVVEYYREKVAPFLVPIMLKSVPEFPYLRDKSIYLAVKLSITNPDVTKQYALVEVPSGLTDRFVVLPGEGDKKFIMFLDDVIRFNMDKIFGLFEYDKLEAYTIKITRDAEIDIDDDVSKGFYEKMKKGIKQRKKGQPVRFLYDGKMPNSLKRYLMDKLELDDDDNVIAGGRYHNSKDFMKFPNVGSPALEWPPLVRLEHPAFAKGGSILSAIDEGDILLHYPYHHFRAFVNYLREAAIHPEVKEIRISIYRLSGNSRVINALISAAKNGKSVTVMIELRARFDEEANLEWSRKLQDAGIKVIFGIPDMKVHCKLVLVTRVRKGQMKHYGVIATGNFNEGTAKVYSDLALFTAHEEICAEIYKVFLFLEKPYRLFRFKHLVVAPAYMRNQFVKKINREIRLAKEGKEAHIFLKLNSLVDEVMIRKLYRAAKAGVKIRIMVRGICSLVPNVPGESENIEVRSIVDRFLEHSRVIIFGNDGQEECYISSADWMTRNLDYRVEVGCIIHDEKVKKELMDFMELQWSDNVKARLIDADQTNQYVGAVTGEAQVRAQFDLYHHITNSQEATPA